MFLAPPLTFDMSDRGEVAEICSWGNKRGKRQVYVICCFLAGHVVFVLFLPNMAGIFSTANHLDIRYWLHELSFNCVRMYIGSSPRVLEQFSLLSYKDEREFGSDSGRHHELHHTAAAFLAHTECSNTNK